MEHHTEILQSHLLMIRLPLSFVSAAQHSKYRPITVLTSSILVTAPSFYYHQHYRLYV